VAGALATGATNTLLVGAGDTLSPLTGVDTISQMPVASIRTWTGVISGWPIPRRWSCLTWCKAWAQWLWEWRHPLRRLRTPQAWTLHWSRHRTPEGEEGTFTW